MWEASANDVGCDAPLPDQPSVGLGGASSHGSRGVPSLLCLLISLALGSCLPLLVVRS